MIEFEVDDYSIRYENKKDDFNKYLHSLGFHSYVGIVYKNTWFWQNDRVFLEIPSGSPREVVVYGDLVLAKKVIEKYCEIFDHINQTITLVHRSPKNRIVYER